MIEHNLTVQNNYFTVDVDSVSKLSEANKTLLEKPNPIDVSNFQKEMSSDKIDDAKAPVSADEAQQLGGQENGDQMLKILAMLLELLTMIIESQKDDAGGDSVDADKDISSSSPAKVENDQIVNEKGNVATGDGEIPKPSEHLQSFNLGDKEITIGGDGSASAGEVGQTKDTLTDLYANSGSFKEMIDSSPNDDFEVSVGRRDDNTSWANEDGRVFMNINDIAPDSSDNFQALTAHEFAHAGVNQQHGDEMKQFEQAVAQEA
ncbi:MAG: hypothetical protein KAH03_00570 [Cocleimonas sp.]|nr:hypothetical protein [Cocleimonas sp.]